MSRRTRLLAFVSCIITNVGLAPPVWPDPVQAVSNMIPSNTSGVVCLNSVAPVSVLCMLSDGSIIYDAKSKTWRKWFVVRDDSDKRSLRVCLAESRDKKDWQVREQPVLVLDQALDYTEPQVSYKNGCYQMWFGKIGSNSDGQIVSAAVGFANSKNGIDWKVCPDSLTLQFESKHVSREFLLNRLRTLSTAYSETSLTM